MSALGLYSLLRTRGWSLVRPHPVARHRKPVGMEGMTERTAPLGPATRAKRLGHLGWVIASDVAGRVRHHGLRRTPPPPALVCAPVGFQAGLPAPPSLGASGLISGTTLK